MDDLKALTDKRALDEMVFRCMHAMDTHQWPQYREQITEDSEFDFTDHAAAPEDANEVMRGADNFLAILASVIEGFDSTQHCVTNMFHELDGDAAQTKCYVTAEHFLNNRSGGRRIACGGRYHIDAVRVDGRWKIRRLKFLTMWFDGNPSLYALAGKRTAQGNSRGAAQ